MMRMPLWFRAFAVALLMQTVSAFLTRILPVLGPVLTDAVGVAPERIGVLASVGSLGTMWYLLAGRSLLPRLGAVRVLQWGSVVGITGLLLALPGQWWLLVLASFLIGVGYGPSPPAGSELLRRHAPARHQGLIFSAKQSGVPLGGALAGLLIPLVLTIGDWRMACVVSAVLAALVTLAVQPWRADIDQHRDTAHRIAWTDAVSPWALAHVFVAVRQPRSLVWMSYAGFGFAVVQGALFAYTVTFLVTRNHWSVAEAGAAFAVMQAAGVVARPAVGWLADRLGSGRRLLVGLAVASSLATAIMALLAPGWPAAAVYALMVAAGLAATSWNGLYMAQVAHCVPMARVGEATSATTFFTFMGYVVGPALFGAVVSWTGTYPPAFLLVALLPLTAAAVLCRLPAQAAPEAKD